MKIKMKQQQQIAGSLPRSPISRQIKFHEYKGPPQAKRQQQQQQQPQKPQANKSQQAPQISRLVGQSHKPHSSKPQAEAVLSSTKGNRWSPSDLEQSAGQPQTSAGHLPYSTAATIHFRDAAANCKLVSPQASGQHPLQFHPSQQQIQLQLSDSRAAAFLVANLGGQLVADQSQLQLQLHPHHNINHQQQHYHHQQQQPQQRLLTLSQAPSFIHSLNSTHSESLEARGHRQSQNQNQNPYQSQAQSHAQGSQSTQWLPMQQLAAPSNGHQNQNQNQIRNQNQVHLHNELLLLATQSYTQTQNHHHEQQQQQQQQQQENQPGNSQQTGCHEFSVTQRAIDGFVGCHVADLEPMVMSFADDITDSLAPESDGELIDACDSVEPSIGAFGREVEDELLFSEFIDLQDVPMNVDESDWLRQTNNDQTASLQLLVAIGFGAFSLFIIEAFTQ